MNLSSASINYIGSKKTLLTKILSIIKDLHKNENVLLGDIFAGTGIIGYSLSNYCNILSNDLEYYSFILNYANLNCIYTDNLKQIIEDLNKLEGISGLIHKYYSPSNLNEYNRMFFTTDNAKKIDAIRTNIELMFSNNKLSENEYKFLLASLLASADYYANTTGVYGAYLKKFKKRSLEEFILKPIHQNCIKSGYNHQVYNMDANILIKNHKFDSVYIDPPYNKRQYGANYFLLNYLARYQEDIEIHGKTGIIKNYNRSNYCSPICIEDTFKDLIDNLDTKLIFVSYNDEGLMNIDYITKLLESKGKLTVYTINYKRYKSNKNKNKNKINEYLFVVNTQEKNI